MEDAVRPYGREEVASSNILVKGVSVKAVACRCVLSCLSCLTICYLVTVYPNMAGYPAHVGVVSNIYSISKRAHRMA